MIGATGEERICVALQQRLDEMEELIVACEMNSEVKSGMEMGQLIARRAGVREALQIAQAVSI